MDKGNNPFLRDLSYLGDCKLVNHFQQSNRFIVDIKNTSYEMGIGGVFG
jgi:hypothetical protein